MRNERAWPLQCWKNRVNGSNIVELRFGDHRTKEMLGVVGWKVWPVSNFEQQHATTSNWICNRVCKRTQHVTSNNVASVCTGLKIDWSVSPFSTLMKPQVSYQGRQVGLRMVFKWLETFLNRFIFPTLIRCKLKLLEILLGPSHTHFSGSKVLLNSLV